MTNLAFGTLGCSGATLDSVIELAKSNDVGALELRVAPDEFLHLDLGADERRAIRARVEAAGLEILALSSYVQLCSPEDQPLDEHLQLAADVGARGVRVFPRDDSADSSPAGTPTPGERRAVERVAAASKVAAIFLETHDTHSQGRRMAAFCQVLDEEVPGHQAKVIWDSAHTWSHGETPAESLELLKPWLEFVQIKDTDSADGYKPVAIGAGDYPIDELLRALADYDGWLSLEWERKWHPELPPLADALPATRNWLTPHP